jgi:hypothetical protein
MQNYAPNRYLTRSKPKSGTPASTERCIRYIVSLIPPPSASGNQPKRLGKTAHIELVKIIQEIHNMAMEISGTDDVTNDNYRSTVDMLMTSRRLNSVQTILQGKQ